MGFVSLCWHVGLLRQDIRSLGKCSRVGLREGVCQVGFEWPLSLRFLVVLNPFCRILESSFFEEFEKFEEGRSEAKVE